jgi:hypothetical protein
MNLRFIQIIATWCLPIELAGCFGGTVEQRPDDWLPVETQTSLSACPAISGHYQELGKAENNDLAFLSEMLFLRFSAENRTLPRGLISSVKIEQDGNEYLHVRAYNPYMQIEGETTLSRNTGDFKCSADGVVLKESMAKVRLFSAGYVQRQYILNRVQDRSLIIKREVWLGAYHAFVPYGGHSVSWVKFETCCSEDYQKSAEERYIDASRLIKDSGWKRLTPSYIKTLTLAGLREQAEAGDVAAQLQLYWDPEEPQRLTWLCRAADQGDANAQYRLGLLYRYGQEGLPQDYIRSYMWYKLAQTNGLLSADPEIDAVTRRISPAQLLEADRLVEEWQPGKCEHDISIVNMGN